MRIFLGIVIFVSSLLLYFAYPLYPGDKWHYILFFIISHAYLAYSCRRQALFLDTFLGIFFWLGFWLKFTLRLFDGGSFYESGGDVSRFDEALLIASIGFVAIMIASWFRGRFIFNYPETLAIRNPSTYFFYQRYRVWLLTVFIVFIILIPTLNFVWGIYQRGEVPKVYLPYHLDGVLKWLLMFGMASFSAMVLRFELEMKRKATIFPVALSIFETFMSCVSMLSRALVINVSAFGYGYWRQTRQDNIPLKPWFIAVVSLIFLALFAASVVGVNYLRASKYNIITVTTKSVEEPASQPSGGENKSDANSQGSLDTPVESAATTNIPAQQQIDFTETITRNFELIWIMTRPLFIERWVGIEGVLGVIHHGELGWDLWREAWQEKYSDIQTSFYDQMINSAYVGIDITKHHFVNMPGIIGFLFYTGSLGFLFFAMFIAYVFASLLEVMAFKLAGGNIIFSALIGQLVVYRLMNFGYVPGQSYLLFGAIILNILIFFGLEQLLRRYYQK